MRTAKFCERNVKVTEAGKTVDILHLHHRADMEVRIVDCFRRCLECRVKPFCRIQLSTIEAMDGETLVNNILQTVQQES